MAGNDDVNQPQRGRQPPHVLAAWIHDQLRDMRQLQVAQLGRLQVQLRSSVSEWDAAVLGEAVASARAAAREIRFEKLRPGWLARRLGQHKPVHARFAAAYERVVDCAGTLKTEFTQLAASYKAHSAAAKRVMVELDLEWKALQAGVEQAVTWLEDLWTQIGAGQPARPSDPDAARLAEAVQAYMRELKHLQGMSGVASEIVVRMQGVLDRRAALLELVRRDVEKFDKSWQRAVGRIAAEVRAGRTSLPPTGEAVEEHDDWMQRLDDTSDAFSALQYEEHVMAQHLEILRREIESGR